MIQTLRSGKMKSPSSCLTYLGRLQTSHFSTRAEGAALTSKQAPPPTPAACLSTVAHTSGSQYRGKVRHRGCLLKDGTGYHSWAAHQHPWYWHL